MTYNFKTSIPSLNDSPFHQTTEIIGATKPIEEPRTLQTENAHTISPLC